MPGCMLQLLGSFCWRGIKHSGHGCWVWDYIILRQSRPWEVISQLSALKPAWLTPTSLCSSPNLPAYKTSRLSLTRGKWFSGTVVCRLPWLLASRVKKTTFLITNSRLSNFWVSCNTRLNPSLVKNPCSLSPRFCSKFLLPMSSWMNSTSLCRNPFFLTFQVASFSVNLYKCLIGAPLQMSLCGDIMIIFKLQFGSWSLGTKSPWPLACSHRHQKRLS